MERKNLLLVEDHEDNRDMYAIRLRHAGYRVFEAEDGEEALDLVAEHQPDLILLDISLPVIDGFMVARIVRNLDQTAAIPIVALTAHDLDANGGEARRIGFDSYLTKPIEPRDVVTCVERLIGRS
jgi:two-component system, cell cycle response regulator DivK